VWLSRLAAIAALVSVTAPTPARTIARAFRIERSPGSWIRGFKFIHRI
jgi:hypothetical protein